MWHDIVNFLMQPFWIPLSRTVMFAVCGYAIIAGTWRERFAGLIYMVSYLIPWLFTLAYSNRSAIVLMLIGDVLCLPGLLTVNRHSPHAWTRWALLCQLLSVAADIADMVLFGARRPPVYIISEAVLSYGVMAALLVGTISARTTKRREQAQSPMPRTTD